MRKLLLSAFVGISLVSESLGGKLPLRNSRTVYVPIYIAVPVYIPIAVKQPAKKPVDDKQKVKDELRKALENLEKASKEAKRLLDQE